MPNQNRPAAKRPAHVPYVPRHRAVLTLRQRAAIAPGIDPLSPSEIDLPSRARCTDDRYNGTCYSAMLCPRHEPYTYALGAARHRLGSERDLETWWRGIVLTQSDPA